MVGHRIFIRFNRSEDERQRKLAANEIREEREKRLRKARAVGKECEKGIRT
jgi:hypothetical protein